MLAGGKVEVANGVDGNLLGSVEPIGQSSDAYWVKIHFLDQETMRIRESTVMQAGFRNSTDKKSDVTTLKVSTTLFSKTPAASEIITDSSNDELEVVLLL